MVSTIVINLILLMICNAKGDNVSDTDIANAQKFRHKRQEITRWKLIYCILPNHPENGQWRVINGTGIPGSRILPNDIIEFSCNSGFELEPKFKYIICDSNWVPWNMPRCIDLCALPPIVGPCHGGIQQYYYEPSNNTCYPFDFGGCAGEYHRFHDLASCVKSCKTIPPPSTVYCTLPRDRGPCKNHTIRWFYDITYGGCSRFWYGGCGGNSNRYNTMAECQKICVTPVGTEICYLPKVEGPCEGYETNWYYDKEQNQCLQFTYGGCLGNSNRFETKEKCVELCVKESSIYMVNVNLTSISQNYTTGSDIDLICIVMGNPKPAVRWYKNGLRLTNSEEIRISVSNMLTIPNATKDDSGDYQCEATNIYSGASDTIHVVVKDKTIHPNCTDSEFFAHCHLMVKGSYCTHSYYTKLCCRSCTEAGLLPLEGPHLHLS